MNVLARRRVPAVVLASILGLLVAALMGPPAHAADDTSSWAVQPADAQGNLDGRTRFEVQAAPGDTVTEMVRISNASTIQRTFKIYATDALNTPTGGFDLLPAADKPSDVGSWTTVAFGEFTIPALNVVAIPITIAVPKNATPGDHVGGIVASVETPATAAAGSSITVDNRVATRLYVRVAGEITPKLEVRNVRASYDFSLVPFGNGGAVVSYDVVNSGNVRIKGDPSVRVTAVFGASVARAVGDPIPEVLPGHAYTVTTRVTGILPLGPLTATVSLRQKASDGPAATIPLVTSSARGGFFAVSPTGLLLLLVLGYGVWGYLRRRRGVRRSGERAWEDMVEAARREARSQVRAEESRMAVALFALLAAAVLFGGPAATDDDPGAIALVVPAATASAHPTGPPSASPSATAPTPTSSATPGGPHHGGWNAPRFPAPHWGHAAWVVTSLGGGLLLFIFGAYNGARFLNWGGALGGWMRGWWR